MKIPFVDVVITPRLVSMIISKDVGMYMLVKEILMPQIDTKYDVYVLIDTGEKTRVLAFYGGKIGTYRMLAVREEIDNMVFDKRTTIHKDFHGFGYQIEEYGEKITRS